MTDSAAQLAREAVYLHQRLFGGLPPDEVVARYVQANQRCLPPGSDRSSAIVDAVVSRRLDPEAVELVLRRRHPLLSRKIQILFYLLEVRSGYYAWFVNPSDAFGRAVVELIGSTLRTGWLFVKGAWLVWRHRLV